MKTPQLIALLSMLAGPSVGQTVRGADATTTGDRNVVVQGSGNRVELTQHQGIEASKFVEFVRIGFATMLEGHKAKRISAENRQQEYEWASRHTNSLQDLYEAEKRENARLEQKIALLNEGLAKTLLRDAYELKSSSEFKAAKARFQDVIAAGQDTIGAVAEARYQLGLIAEIEVSLLDAADEFELAARIEPSFERLDKAIEYQVLVGNLEKAEPLAQDLISFSRQSHGDTSAETAEAHYILGEVLDAQGHPFKTIAAIDTAVDIARSVPGSRSPRLTVYMTQQANGLIEMGALSEAETVLSQSHEWIDDATNPGIKATVFAATARLAAEKGEYQSALDAQLRAVQMEKESVGPQHVDYLSAKAALTAYHLKLNEPDAAVANAQEVLDQTEALLGRTHIFTIDSMVDLLGARQTRYGINDMTEQMADIVYLTEEAVGKAHPSYAARLHALGVQLRLHGALEDGHQMISEALVLTEAIYGKTHKTYADVLSSLAMAESTQDTARAHRLAQEALDITRALYGETHPSYGDRLFGLGVLLMEAGQAKSAEPMLKKAAKISLANFGPDDPEFAAVLAYHSIALTQIGKRQTALETAKKALEIANAANDFPTFAKLIGNQIVGVTYFNQGRHREAEPYLRMASKISKDVSGGRTIDLQASTTLGGVLAFTERAADAVLLLEKTRSDIVAHEGKASVIHGIASNNLGLAYNFVGRLEEAEDAYRDALSVFDKDGVAHALAGQINANLAGLLAETNRFRDARPYFERALDLTKRMHGEESQGYVVSLASYADQLSRNSFHILAEEKARLAADLAIAHLEPSLQEYGSARYILTLVLERRKKFDAALANQTELVSALKAAPYAAETTRVAQLNNLGILLDRVGRLDDAIATFRELVALGRQGAEGTSPERMETHISNLASNLHQRGDYPEAETLFREVIEMKELRGDFAEQSDQALALARLLYDMDRKKEAEALHKDAVDLSKKALGQPGVKTAQKLFWLSDFYRKEENFDRALRYLDRALGELEYSVGSDHETYAIYLRKRAELEFSLREFQDAEQSLNKAARITALHFPPDHINHARIATTFSTLAYVQGDLDLAERHARAALEIYKKLDVDLSEALAHLSGVLRAAGDFDAAEGILRDILASHVPRTISEMMNHADYQSRLARILIDKKEFIDAATLMEQIDREVLAGLPNIKFVRIKVLSLQSRALAHAGDYQEARRVADEAGNLAKQKGLSDRMSGFRVKRARAVLEAYLDGTKIGHSSSGVLEFLNEHYSQNHPLFTETKRELFTASNQR